MEGSGQPCLQHNPVEALLGAPRARQPSIYQLSQEGQKRLTGLLKDLLNRKYTLQK